MEKIIYENRDICAVKKFQTPPPPVQFTLRETKLVWREDQLDNRAVERIDRLQNQNLANNQDLPSKIEDIRFLGHNSGAVTAYI